MAPLKPSCCHAISYSSTFPSPPLRTDSGAVLLNIIRDGFNRVNYMSVKHYLEYVWGIVIGSALSEREVLRVF